MNKMILSVIVVVTIGSPVAMWSQAKPTSATYITKEEVDKVNAVPGIDRTIRVVDIGGEHFAVALSIASTPLQVAVAPAVERAVEQPGPGRLHLPVAGS